MASLRQIHVGGFASLRDVDLDVGRVNVLIGGNGAGKSNLVMLLRMLKAIYIEGFQRFVAEAGGANSLLHYGAKTTPEMDVVLGFEADNGHATYSVQLAAAAPDRLVFADETVDWCRMEDGSPESRSLGVGHPETQLGVAEGAGCRAAYFLRRRLDGLCAYHFHDTSRFAAIRTKRYIRDEFELRSDGSNLAPFLRKLEIARPEYYRRIVETIRQVAPHFGDFYLEPDPANRNNNMLNWIEAGTRYLFGPHQLPDGLLRFMALATLLLEPSDDVYHPSLIVIDEPELGLHPFALNILASLIRKASVHSQIILATHSVRLVDQFQPEDIITVTRENGASVFRRLDSGGLAEWLKDYSLGELWEKNVIGGRPSR